MIDLVTKDNRGARTSTYDPCRSFRLSVQVKINLIKKVQQYTCSWLANINYDDDDKSALYKSRITRHSLVYFFSSLLKYSLHIHEQGHISGWAKSTSRERVEKNSFSFRYRIEWNISFGFCWLFVQVKIKTCWKKDEWWTLTSIG